MRAGIGADEGRGEVRVITETAIVAGFAEHERQAYILFYECLMASTCRYGSHAPGAMRAQNADRGERRGVN